MILKVASQTLLHDGVNRQQACVMMTSAGPGARRPGDGGAEDNRHQKVMTRRDLRRWLNSGANAWSAREPEGYGTSKISMVAVEASDNSSATQPPGELKERRSYGGPKSAV